MAETERLNVAARNKLIALLPRLRRFSTVLAGRQDSGDTLLRTACKRILDRSHDYQEGTAFDVWAFGELHNVWLEELRSNDSPISKGQGDTSAFMPSVPTDNAKEFREIAGILARLPPQQRCAALLVYGEGFSYQEAARILDVEPQTLLARASRSLASFIEHAGWLDSAGLYGATIEHLDQSNRQAV